jgi:DNA-binding PadR family transcriptional regulator
MPKETEPEIPALLPLAPAFFHILSALGDGERHGYSIMQEVAARTGGRVRMSPGTLYGSIKRILEEGLIEELDSRAAAARDARAKASDERRRYYRITAFGRRVAAAERERLSTLLSQARASGLVPERQNAHSPTSSR